MAFQWNLEQPPFSFCLGGQSSRQVMASWESEVAADHGDGRRQYRYRDPVTGLCVCAQVTGYEGFPAWEWVLELSNEGPGDTPPITDLMALDLVVPAGDGDPLLHHAKGSVCEIDDFVPRVTRLRQGAQVEIKPVGGRSSNGVLPFMNLQTATGGYAVAIGWSGQWRARFGRAGDQVTMAAGMEHLATYLRPGEAIRSPRLLLIEWEGDDADTGTNLLRRVLLEHYSQRNRDGSLATPPTAHPRQLVYYFTGHVSEEDHLAAIDRAAEIGLEAFWVDALWYGAGEQWWEEVGNWTINRKRFPRGLKPIADKAHAKGMKFILWFEPERVRPKTPLAQEHPDFLLRHPEQSDNLLLDLGNPEARQWMTETIWGVLEEVGVDIYRQDFNFDPIEYWLAADEPGRRGMTEMRHIEGLYAMWDELRARRPGLIIDNCSSGGRRLDLETTSRAFPLWRSDYTDAGAATEGLRCEIGAQCQTAGLSRWLPLHTASVWRLEPYSVRSAVSTGLVFYPDIRPDDYPIDAAHQALAEMARLRPFFLGDHHLLLPLTAAEHDWCAHQFHRADLGAGIALFFRRHHSPFPTMECALKQIDGAARYEVTTATDWRRSAPRQVPGRELAQLAVSLPGQPSSQLLEYRQV
ncbi:MAG: glycoside hydrolase family 36 protein [Gemmatimonadota bacterium]